MPDNVKRKWTVFFIIKSVETDSIDDAITMVNELRDIYYGDVVSVVFCVQVVEKWLPALLAGDVNVSEEGNDTRTTAFLCLREDIHGQSRFKNLLVELERRDEFDLTTVSALVEYFEKIIIAKFPSERHLLFTWNHGNGYGIFAGGSSVTVLNDQIARKTIDQHLYIKSVQKAEHFTDAPVEVLSMNELGEALSIAFKTKKIDLVVMMNCYMQYFNTGYALKGSVDYLIAPESYIYFSGYNYSSIISELLRDPDQPSRNLAVHVVQSLEGKQYPSPALREEALAATALVTVDLSLYTEMADHVDELVAKMKVEMPSNMKKLVKARHNTFKVKDALWGVDFFDFLQQLKAQMPRHWQSDLIEKIMRTRKSLVVSAIIGKSLCKKPHGCPMGYMLYFPLVFSGDFYNGEIRKFFGDTSYFLERDWHDFALMFINVPRVT